MIKARISSLSIGQASETEKIFKIVLLEFISQICAISGAEVPPTEEGLDILCKEMKIFLLTFGYKSYNFEELTLAFRINAAGAKLPTGEDMQKVYFKGALNINLTADVFANYKILRDTLDRKLQNQIDGYA